jgi:cleavage and polyadenylation specificity factor subunit 3
MLSCQTHWDPIFPAQDILNEPEEIQSLRGSPIPRRISVDYISFSAHVDYTQNSEFIELVKAQHVVSPPCSHLPGWISSMRCILQVLVHGEQTAMGRLKGALQSRYKDRDEDVKIHTPRNLETLNLNFRGERVAKVR